MDSDDSEEVKTFEDTRADSEKGKETPHFETEECKERLERRRNRTKNGLEFDLGIATKKKERAAKDVRARIKATYETSRDLVDLVKLNACKDGLEAELNN